MRDEQVTGFLALPAAPSAKQSSPRCGVYVYTPLVRFIDGVDLGLAKIGVDLTRHSGHVRCRGGLGTTRRNAPCPSCSIDCFAISAMIFWYVLLPANRPLPFNSSASHGRSMAWVHRSKILKFSNGSSGPFLVRLGVP